MDSSTFPLWKNANGTPGSNLLALCAVQPDLNTKLLQGDATLTRSITMPANRAFSKIRISFDLYYLNLWSQVETISVYANSLLVYDEKPNLSASVDFPLRFCNLRPFGKSYEEKLVRVDQEIAFNDPNLDIEIVHTFVVPTSDYGIRTFLLQVYFCDDLCEECDEFQCLTCKLGYDIVNYQCRCGSNSFSYFAPDLTCVTECPLNYIPDNNKICQPATVVQEFIDLDQDTFSEYKFDFLGDKYYTATNSAMIHTIDSKSVAGMFGNTDSLTFNNLNLVAGQTYQATFTLYITGQLQKIIPDQILLKVNDYVAFKISDFSNPAIVNTVGSGNAYVVSRAICTAAGYTRCMKYGIELYFQLSEDGQNLSFTSKYNLNTPSRKWAMRNFQINSYSITTTSITCLSNCATCNPHSIDVCLSCSGSLNLFNGQCISTCPDYTSASANICVDTSLTSSTAYAANFFYSSNNFPLDIDHNYFTGLDISSSYFMGYIMLGGYQSWSTQQIVHNVKHLPAFYSVVIKFQLVFIDSINSQIFLRTSINNEQPQYNMFGSGVSVSNQVGQYYDEVVQSVTYMKYFTSTTDLSVQLQCIQDIDDQAYCGIYNYRIVIAKCPNFCQQCDEYGNCITGIDTIEADISGCKQGYYQNNGSCLSCGAYCITCTDSSQCTQCQSGLELKHGACYCTAVKDINPYCEQTNCFHNCQTCSNDRRKLDLRQKHLENCLSCDESRHLWLNVNQCTCLDGYYMENFECYICYPTCKKCSNRARQCSECFPGQNRILISQQCECQDGYFQAGNDLVCSKCNDLCQKCSLSTTTCKACYSSQNRKLYNDTCICMDGYYDVGQLLCAKCPSNCKTCSDANTCLTCDDSEFRQLSINNKSCVCLSGYYDFAGSYVCGKCASSCQECKDSSDSSHCIRCPQTREPTAATAEFSCKCRRGYYESGNLDCLDCADYLNPPSTHYCYSNCGDGIVQWDEDCDDGNTIQRDNCYKCLFSNSFCLDNTCTGCRAGQCTGCIDGFYLTSDFICLPCDQSCKACTDRSDKCTDCTILKPDGSGCIVCESNIGFQIVNDACVNICGDGIKVAPEQCDDGNNSFGDGCDASCQIEIGFSCDTLCEEIIYPSMLFELNQQEQPYDNERIVRLRTDQLVSINGGIDSIFSFKINNSNNYQVSYVDLTTYSDKYNQLFLELSIKLESAVPDPELICQILNQDAILNKQGNSFKQKNYIIQLTPYEPPNNSTEQATDGLMKLSKYILYLLLGFAILAFLFGGLNIFWNLLDALQLVSYLQFLNVNYPYNVNNYFTIFGFAQFDFIKQYVNLESFISQYVDTPNADQKFYNQGYSTVFYVNIITVFTVFVTTLITYIGCRILFQALTKIAHSFIYAPLDSPEQGEQSVCTFFIYRVTRNLQVSLLKITQEFMSGVIRTFMAVAFDYNLAIFLQLQDIVFQDAILFSSFIFCMLAFAAEIYFISQAIIFMSKPSYVFKQKVIENNFGAIYEGVKLEKNPYTYYFNIMILGKKMLFMMILVLFYSAPCLQVGLVSLLNFAMAGYIYKVSPLIDKDEQIKQIGSELTIWVAELFILALAMNENTNGLSENGQLNLGWCIIASTSFLILFQLYLDVKQHINFLVEEYSIIKKLIERFRMFLNNKEPEQEQNIFLKGRRRMGIENLTSQNNIMTTKNNRSLASLKQGKVVTFTLSSSSS